MENSIKHYNYQKYLQELKVDLEKIRKENKELREENLSAGNHLKIA